MSDRVFEDRLGLYVVNPQNLAHRIPAIAARDMVDVFLPRIATAADIKRVRKDGLYAHMWWATDALSAKEYAERTLADIERLRPGAGELNIELPSDWPLAGYIEEVIRLIRAKRPYYRLRINVAPFKGFALPIARLVEDPHLYAAEQSYMGDMSPFSPADVLFDMLAWGVPREKATVCYGGAGPVPGSPGRVCTLPELRRPMRGVVFQDDLLAEVGLLP